MPASVRLARASDPARAAAPAPTDAESSRRRLLRARARWLVHLGLVGAFAGSLLALMLTRGLTLHALTGAIFVVLTAVHVGQRRRTVSALLSQLARATRLVRPRGRLALSDLVLAGLTLNVLASGLVDWLRGEKTSLPLQDLGLPGRFVSWHAVSAVVLLAYLIAHVVRRRRRLWTSSIR